MHMSDALISPEVGLTGIAIAAAVVAYHGVKLDKQEDMLQKLPLIGIMGAFVFVAQMINFAIPGTGSSGHIAGSLMLAIILGPSAAIIIISSILVIQALLFGDGGILALGTNIINMGIVPCFIVYPLVWKTIVGQQLTRKKVLVASCIAGMLAMSLGALGVVVETYMSGIAQIPFTEFILLMIPIHVLIGLGEGLITSAVVWFAMQQNMIQNDNLTRQPLKKSTVIGAVLGLMIPVIALTWFASSQPDGLEWSLERSSAQLAEDAPPTPIHQFAQNLQERTTIMPDYTFGGEADSETAEQVNYMLIALIGSMIMVALLSMISGGIYLSRRKKIAK